MSRLPQLRRLTVAGSLALAALVSVGPAASQSYGPGGSNPPPAPGGYGSDQQAAANPALAPFRDVLQRFGSIQSHARYGEVWTPAPGVVPQGWSPYPACHWSYDQQQRAWTYQDPTEWGNIVHHYGRWAFDGQLGWMWIADAGYGPGWVFWRNDAQSVGWAPLTPESDGTQPPQDGWQSQDAATFRSGCRPAAPPAPLSYAPQPQAPAYASYLAAPVYPRPVYVPQPMPRPIPVVQPLPPVFVPPFIPRPPAPPAPPVPPHSDCSMRPNDPMCHPVPKPPIPTTNVDCRFQTFRAQPGCTTTTPTRTTTPTTTADNCATRPFLPHCRRFPNGPTRGPGQIGHGPLPGHGLGQLTHPRFVFGGMGNRPVFRPGGFGGFGGRPFFGRPAFAGRPSFARPAFGGTRFAGHFRR